MKIQQLYQNANFILTFVQEHIYNCLGSEIEPSLICLVGSRVKGNSRADSDLDIAIQYIGDIREDDVFNELMADPLFVEGIKVDIIPYQEEKGNVISLEEGTFILLYQKEEVEYCEERMKRFTRKDAFLKFVLNDLVMKRNHLEKDALRIMYNSYVLEDSEMELHYNQA